MSFIFHGICVVYQTRNLTSCRCRAIKTEVTRKIGKCGATRTPNGGRTAVSRACSSSLWTQSHRISCVFFDVNRSIEFYFSHFIMNDVLIVCTRHRFQCLPFMLGLRFNSIVQQFQLIFIASGSWIDHSTCNGYSRSVDIKRYRIWSKVSRIPCSACITTCKPTASVE